MVSASNQNDSGLGLIPEHSRLVIFDIKTSGRKLALLTCAAGCVVLCVTHNDMPRTEKVPECRTDRYNLIQRLAHVCTLGPNRLAQVQTSKESSRKGQNDIPTVPLDQRCRHLGNLTSSETKMARLPYCRDVTVGMSSSSGLTPLLRRATERWQEMPVSLK